MQMWFEAPQVWILGAGLLILCIALAILIVKKWASLQAQKKSKEQLVDKLTNHYEHHSH